MWAIFPHSQARERSGGGVLLGSEPSGTATLQLAKDPTSFDAVRVDFGSLNGYDVGSVFVPHPRTGSSYKAAFPSSSTSAQSFSFSFTTSSVSALSYASQRVFMAVGYRY